MTEQDLNGAGSATGQGGVRWRKFALVAVPSFAAAGAIVGLTAQGALAASFAVAGQKAKLSATTITATGFSQFGTVDKSVDGQSRPVLVSGFKNADLVGLCQSVVIPSPLGDVTIRLTAGTADNPVKATNLVSDSTIQTGNIAFTNYESGLPANTLTKGPGAGSDGLFGQQADKIVLQNATLDSWATTAGSFTLPGLTLTTKVGKDECW